MFHKTVKWPLSDQDHVISSYPLLQTERDREGVVKSTEDNETSMQQKAPDRRDDTR